VRRVGRGSRLRGRSRGHHGGALPLLRASLEKRARAAPERFRRVLVADDSPFSPGARVFSDLPAAGRRDPHGSRRRRGRRTGRGVPQGAQGRELGDPRPAHAAALRHARGCGAAAMERGFGVPRCSIVFLSSRRIDESFRPLLTELEPAYYVNKARRGGASGGETRGDSARRAAATPQADRRSD